MSELIFWFRLGGFAAGPKPKNSECGKLEKASNEKINTALRWNQVALKKIINTIRQSPKALLKLAEAEASCHKLMLF
ncbi:hypothetical protein EG349_00620 [Chryseobacterium shandongense]|uniref:Uncharacterized protein n=1 Tax=Chryseobacterium shandongense TaxID=1493872 RepID=A0AAD1DKC3_9FLAO|nr:hypothetical protein EG349_00620 [Chryseobacterium shandongense]AZA97508.1 hypothetical protein EG353_19090 [Chryseobacterium shandongense]